MQTLVTFDSLEDLIILTNNIDGLNEDFNDDSYEYAVAELKQENFEDYCFWEVIVEQVSNNFQFFGYKVKKV